LYGAHVVEGLFFLEVHAQLVELLTGSTFGSFDTGKRPLELVAGIHVLSARLAGRRAVRFPGCLHGRRSLFLVPRFELGQLFFGTLELFGSECVLRGTGLLFARNGPEISVFEIEGGKVRLFGFRLFGSRLFGS
jgi:hypothetical protein